MGKMDEQIASLQEYKSDINDLEQHGWKNSLRIVGMEHNTERETVEECIDKVVVLVSKTLDVRLEIRDIDIAHRLGKFKKNKPRTIIVKFTHRTKKAEIIRGRRKLKGSEIVIFGVRTRRNCQKLTN